MAEVIRGYDAVDLSIVSMSDGDGMRGPELGFYAQSTDVVALVQPEKNGKEQAPDVSYTTPKLTEVFTAPIVSKYPYSLHSNEGIEL